MPAVRVAVTLGDPAGIGPEIVAAALRTPIPDVQWTVIGPASHVGEFKTDHETVVIPGPDIEPGHPGPESGRIALASIDRGCDQALARKVDALVTAPVSKAQISASGFPFTGHTEHLAARCGVRHPVMMFCGASFRLTLVTTHLPLRKITLALKPEGIVHAIRETEQALRRWFGISEPRIAVCGLNPHAGEEGLLGTEERDIILPALQLAREKGVRCEGPFAADTVFRRTGFDAIVSMYHDQALPVLKTVDPSAVNVTLGLPFVRTSPDHGTAFDIAGRGTADPLPMRRALELAVHLARVSRPLL